MKIDLNKIKSLTLDQFRDKADFRWFAFWLLGMMFMLLWTGLFLNTPAYNSLINAVFNSFFAGFVTLLFSGVIAWGFTLAIEYSKNESTGILNKVLMFVLDVFRSIPQIIGILIGYIILTFLLNKEIITSGYGQLIWMSFFISLFVFQEITDMLLERIEYFRKTDFFNALVSLGVNEFRIYNYEIFYKNSLAYIVQKMISIFGITLFLQCSIDFIVSVGLTHDVFLSNFPVTLGNLLASMDSKQDILAVGKLFTDPFYFHNLFFRHLQGLSTAFVIVFSLFASYKISDSFLRRKRI